MIKIDEAESYNINGTIRSNSGYFSQATNIYFSCPAYKSPLSNQKKNPFIKICKTIEPKRIGSTKPAIKLSTTIRIRSNL